MDRAAVLNSVRALGGALPRTLVVGCEPTDVTDGMGLSPVVEAAVGPAVELLHEVLEEHHAPVTIPTP